jgi:capsule polysaccharide export protein KpsE/RkpR
MSQQAALTPNSPKAAASREQVRSLEDEILRRKLQIAGTNASAANQLGKFEELVLKRELAAKSLENAVLSRDKARQNVEQQHMYVQTITQPNLPDTARYPRTMLDLLGVGAISLLIFLVLRGFRDVALEHKA